MSVPKHPEPTRGDVPAPIVFGDEPETAEDIAAAFASFSEDEETAPHERPEGWASLAARRLRSLSGEDPRG